VLNSKNSSDEAIASEGLTWRIPPNRKALAMHIPAIGAFFSWKSFQLCSAGHHRASRPFGPLYNAISRRRQMVGAGGIPPL
jgi:hypothetical protein